MRAGYAICNPDPRGIAESEGDSAMFGRQEGEDCYDLIEWLAVQDWCTGKVAMSGTSYLTVAQWITAAEQLRLDDATLRALDDAMTPGEVAGTRTSPYDANIEL